MYSPIASKGRGRYGNNLWDSYSPKLKRIVKLYSDLEFDHWILIETDPNVITYCEQPYKLVYHKDGERQESIFDMWVRHRDATETFIEVKYEKDLSPQNPDKRAIKQTKIQRLWCEDNGFNYKIKTERDIRESSILLANMKELLPYIKNRPYVIETDKLRLLRLITAQPLNLQEIYLKNPDVAPSRLRETLYWLIYKGMISSNVDQVALGPQTEVWANVSKKVY